ncbi:MAG: nickel-responsive transcriptional regulator NikR [Nitrososphaeria archaeon]
MENTKGNRAERISITLPRNMLMDLEKSMQEIGIKKRSMLMRRAIESFIKENQALRRKDEEECVGNINYIYEHDKKELLDRLLDIQHHFGEIIISTVHIHLDSKRCFETLIIKGKSKTIRELINEFRKVKVANLTYQLI